MSHDLSLQSQGVQSVEIGLALFQVLLAQPGPIGLSDLARAAGMHRSKAHRYLASLQRAGWVAQEPDSGLYGLGPQVGELARAWMARQDPLQHACHAARELARAQGQTCLVAVWGQGGATAVRVFQPPRMVSIAVPEGAVLDAESSATGRVFEVWGDAPVGRLGAVQSKRIRQQGLAVVEGEHVAGINAIAAPVLDAQGRLLLALTLVGPASSLAADAAGPGAQALLAACRRLPRQLLSPALSSGPS